MADANKSTLYLWDGTALFIGGLSDNSPHKHLAAQICFGLDGPLKVFIEGAWHESRFVMIPANVPHQLASGDTRLALALIDGLGFEGRQITKIGVFFGDEIPDDFTDLPASVDAAKVRLNQILGKVLENYSPAIRPTELDSRIKKSLEYIDAHIEQPLNSAELASIACLSDSRFMHLFTKNVGLPMRRYILWRRIFCTIDAVNKGADLTAAAHLAGFSDSAHFSRTFRQTFGLSPSEIFKNSRNIQVIS